VAASRWGCPHWTIGVVTGFAGPLVELCGLDTYGYTMSGLTSIGKTTSHLLAASVWSTPSLLGDGLCQSARMTGNSIEIAARRANGIVLVLDEMNTVDGKTAASFIYTVASGVGKERMNPDGSSRDKTKWSTFLATSCETSLEHKIRSDGGKFMPGMTARII